MELSDFIQKSVTEVLDGVEKAGTGKQKFELVHNLGIEFDVAVTSSSAKSAKGGITVLSARAKTSEEKIHRLRFRVQPKKKK